MKNRNANHNHFVMKVEDTTNNNREIANAYFDGTQAYGVDINWESEINCAHCGNLIESAYGVSE